MSLSAKYKNKSNKVVHIDNNVPFDISYHKKLSEDEWKRHQDSIKFNIDNLTNEKIILNKRKEGDEEENRKKKIKYEEIQEQNVVPLQKLSEEKFKNRLDTFGSFMKAIGILLAWFFKHLYEVLAYISNTLLSGIKTFVKSDVIIGAIFFVIFIMFILSYIFGVIFPFSNKNLPTNNTTDYNLAEEKLEYNKEMTFTEKTLYMINNIGMVFTNFRKTLNNLSGRFNLVNDKANYINMKDRQEYKEGRWDNVNNMELSKLSQNFKNVSNDNMIYSIKKPKDFEFITTTYDNDMDINKLPTVFKDEINASNKNLKLHWKETTAVNGNMVKYVLQCNPYNDNNKELKLFNDKGDTCEVYKYNYNDGIDTLNSFDLPKNRYEFSNGLDDYV